jgi:hypothetical protein
LAWGLSDKQYSAFSIANSWNRFFAVFPKVAIGANDDFRRNTIQ